MNEHISEVVDAAQTIIDATEVSQSPKPPDVADVVEVGVAAGVAEATKIVQSELEVKAWQEQMTGQMSSLAAMMEGVRSTLADISVMMAVPPENPAAPVILAENSVGDPRPENPLELPPVIAEEVAATEAVELTPVEVPVLAANLQNKGRRAASQRRWL